MTATIEPQKVMSEADELHLLDRLRRLLGLARRAEKADIVQTLRIHCGYTVVGIAQQIGVPPESVRRWLYCQGIRLGRHRASNEQRVAPSTIDRVRDASPTVSAAELGARLGVSKRTVQRARRVIREPDELPPITMSMPLYGIPCGHCHQPATGMAIVGEHLVVEHQDADGNRIKLCGAPCPHTSPQRA